MATITKTRKKKTSYRRILEKFFSTPAIILIGSYEGGRSIPWKTGKTDFFLKVSEDLLKLGLVDEVASNIETYGHYPCITDLQTTKVWLNRNDKTKLFGLDEANIHLPSRRAMSTKSVDIIQVFPEISKARARLIVIAQKLSALDSELRSFGWVRGYFQKYDLKTVYVSSPLLSKQYWFRNVKPTTIKFDPYLPAPFTLLPTAPTQFDDLELDKLRTWTYNNSTWKELGFKHPNQFNRWLRKQTKKLIERVSLITTISVGGKG